MKTSLYKNFKNFESFVEENQTNELNDYLKFYFFEEDYIDIFFENFCLDSEDEGYYKALEQVQKSEDVSVKKKNSNSFIILLKKFQFTDFLQHSEKIENYVSDLIDKFFTFLSDDFDKNAVYLLLYEILINIYMHSEFKMAFIVGCFCKTTEKLDILITDDGLSIPKTLEDTGFSFKMILMLFLQV